MRKQCQNTSGSRYNSYKLLGYDVMLDSMLNPHLLEVNTRPSAYTELLDQAVNEPMVQEMFRLVGYHIPTNAELEPICQMLNIPLEKAKTLLYDDGVYRKILSKKSLEKQFKFEKIKERGNWIDEITDEF